MTADNRIWKRVLTNGKTSKIFIIMKRNLSGFSIQTLLTIICVTVSVSGIAQAPAQPDAASEAFYKKAMPVLKPEYKKIVLQTAGGLRDRTPDSDSLVKALKQNPALNSLAAADIEALAFLAMMEASKSASEDVKSVMNSMKEVNKQKQTTRLKTAKLDSTKTTRQIQVNDRDSLADLSEEKQLRLQVYTDRRSKATTMISNLMKKFSNIQDQVLSNLK